MELFKFEMANDVNGKFSKGDEVTIEGIEKTKSGYRFKNDSDKDFTYTETDNNKLHIK
jgi:hypothetical protein